MSKDQGTQPKEAFSESFQKALQTSALGTASLASLAGKILGANPRAAGVLRVVTHAANAGKTMLKHQRNQVAAQKTNEKKTPHTPL